NRVVPGDAQRVLQARATTSDDPVSRARPRHGRSAEPRLAESARLVERLREENRQSARQDLQVLADSLGGPIDLCPGRGGVSPSAATLAWSKPLTTALIYLTHPPLCCRLLL